MGAGGQLAKAGAVTIVSPKTKLQTAYFINPSLLEFDHQTGTALAGGREFETAIYENGAALFGRGGLDIQRRLPTL